MSMKNTQTHYGWMSRLLHWTIALLVATQFGLIYIKRYILEKGSEQASFYMNGLHKPLGLVLLVLVLFAMFWQSINLHPQLPASMSKLERILARIMHKALLIGTLCMSISGLIMTTAAGYPPNFFGLYQLPNFIEQNKALSESCFWIHGTLSNLLMCLVILHMLAALKHHFIDKDDVLKRML